MTSGYRQGYIKIPLTCKGIRYTLAMEWAQLWIFIDISHVEDAYNSSSTVTHVALSSYAIMLQEDHMEQALGLMLSRALPSLLGDPTSMEANLSLLFK